MKLKMLPLLSVLALMGCDIDLKLKVNAEDLFAIKQQHITGDLAFSVASCSDYHDSRQPSSSLLKVKDKVPSIFQGAKYVECYKKELDSYAIFTIPIQVGAQGQAAQIEDVWLTSNKENNEFATILLSEKLRDKIQTAQNDALNDFSFYISVMVNPPKQKTELLAFGVYAESKQHDFTPLAYDTIELSPELPMTFTLSDVATDYLLENGHYTFLVIPD